MNKENRLQELEIRCEAQSKHISELREEIRGLATANASNQNDLFKSWVRLAFVYVQKASDCDLYRYEADVAYALLRKSNKGFSLISVMITVAIMSIIALGMMQLIENTVTAANTGEAKNNVNSLIATELGVASNPVTCTQAITQVDQGINSLSSFDIVSNGGILSQFNLTVKNVSFSNPVLTQTGSDGTTVYSGYLTMDLVANKQVYGGKTFSTRTIAGIYVTVSPAGIITGCGTVSPTLPQIPPPVQPPVSNPIPTAGGTKGCSDIGGVYSNGVCTFNSNKHNGDSGNDDGDCDSH